MREYYKTLNVTEDASQADIKKAYKKLAMEHHPDRGGEKETFAKIAEAYVVLSDPKRRTQYDETGDTEFIDIRHQAVQKLAEFFAAWLTQFMAEPNRNMVDDVRKGINQGLSEISVQLVTVRSKIQQAKKHIGNTKTNNDAANIFEGTVNQMIDGMQRQKEHLDSEHKIMEMTGDLLDDYEFIGEEIMQSLSFGDGYVSANSGATSW